MVDSAAQSTCTGRLTQAPADGTSQSVFLELHVQLQRIDAVHQSEGLVWIECRLTLPSRFAVIIADHPKIFPTPFVITELPGIETEQALVFGRRFVDAL